MQYSVQRASPAEVVPQRRVVVVPRRCVEHLPAPAQTMLSLGLLGLPGQAAAWWP